MTTKIKTVIRILIGASVWMFLAASLGAADGDIVVVVNKSNPIDNVTKAQLKRMMLGEQGKWSADKKVVVVLRAAGQPERTTALKTICGMSEDDYNQHIMHADFAGGSAEPPKTMGSAAAVRDAVAGTPGGIGFMRASDVNGSVKAISVDGISAGEPGYKVR